MLLSSDPPEVVIVNSWYQKGFLDYNKHNTMKHYIFKSIYINDLTCQVSTHISDPHLLSYQLLYWIQYTWYIILFFSNKIIGSTHFYTRVRPCISSLAKTCNVLTCLKVEQHEDRSKHWVGRIFKRLSWLIYTEPNIYFNIYIL